ncbi:MAG TPA: ABC transporter permease subunit [Anaerolineales bacterium]|nr:ABC transporter permease subunit [Anaerolineales bacterium]
MNNKKPDIRRSVMTALIVLVALLIYAYGFQITKVNLEQTKSEHRREQLFRILRALARPDLIEYEQEAVDVSIPFMTPCPESGFTPPPVEELSGPYLVVTPACAEPRSFVTVEGFNFTPRWRGPINFVPYESGVKLPMGSITVDESGYFTVTERLPNRPAEDVHEIVATTRQNVGPPMLTRTAHDTWDKIVETVFLALLATTLGVMLSVPLSFFSARNLMRDVSTTLTSASLAVLLIPVGIYAGARLADWIAAQTQPYQSNMPVVLIGIVVGVILIRFALRWALPTRDEDVPTPQVRLTRLAVLIVAGMLAVGVLYFVAYLGLWFGARLELALNTFSFIGRFIRDLGDILNMLIKVAVALAVAGIFNNIGGKLGVEISRRRGVGLRIIHTVLAVAAGAMLLVLIAAAINWLYQFRDWMTFYTRMGAVGAVLGLLLAIRYKPTESVRTGMVIYYVSRTIFNGLRSIEALVMAIVFVVWVGVGPFAGSLALALHTVAALSKLYSEQVESIMAGPIEAVKATGATRVQTIIYAVVPQIVPPYISFTMYRWDINVRMSTIIGFVGGGGIGFLLQQNINLLNYRAASAQMLAIAIVVATMDYFSSWLRERVI